MKTPLLATWALVCFAYVFAIAQKPGTPKPTEPAWAKKLPEHHMLMGSYYYPEHWPKERWEGDLRAMALAGFGFTHFAEFAWDRLEPEEGKFSFGWLDSALKVADGQGLKVVLCTPTATPPAWLTHKYPEVLSGKYDGTLYRHGSRQHASWASTVYQGHVKRLTEAMAQRYGQDKRVIGWQLDNEPSHYGKYDYSPANRDGFVKWLQQRYGTLAKLNQAWGTAFWSLTYTSWEQVRIPNPAELIVQPNPHAMVDFSRYTAASIANFLDAQALTLKQHISPEQWVTTNYMGVEGHTHADPKLTKSLDFACFTQYPACGNEGLPSSGDENYRIGNPYGVAMTQQLFMGIRPDRVSGVMELQPGQTNWGSFNPQPLPGVIRLWLWHSYALGCRFACNYRWDQPTYGAEQYYNALTYPDGRTLRPTGIEWATTNTELAKAQVHAQAGMQKQAPVALILNQDNLWSTQTNRLTEQWAYYAHAMRYYKALRQLGISVDVKLKAENLSGYKVVISPALDQVRPHELAEFEKVPKHGGYWILTSRSLQRDTNTHLLGTTFSVPLSQAAGIEVERVDVLPPNKYAEVEMEGAAYKWNNWADVLEPKPGTQVWGKYAKTFYAGRASVTYKPIDKGAVLYVGADSDDGTLEYAVIKKLATIAQLETKALPEGVFVEHRSGLTIVLNYGQTTYVHSVPSTAKVLVGTADGKVASMQVLVYR